MRAKSSGTAQEVVMDPQACRVCGVVHRGMTGRQLVGHDVWLKHRHASDWASLVPDPRTPLRVMSWVHGLFHVQVIDAAGLPVGPQIPLTQKYVAQVCPVEQVRLDEAKRASMAARGGRSLRFA